MMLNLYKKKPVSICQKAKKNRSKKKAKKSRLHAGKISKIQCQRQRWQSLPAAYFAVPVVIDLAEKSSALGPFPINCGGGDFLCKWYSVGGQAAEKGRAI